MGPLVLIVDDDLGLLKMMSRSLELEGFRVIAIDDGSLALGLAATQGPDMVLLDITMPGIDGLEVCELLKGFSNIPVVMLTGRGQPEDIARGLDRGADAYVVKPFDTGNLLSIIDTVLRRGTAPAGWQAQQRVGEVVIDNARRLVVLPGRQVHLTSTEHALLSMLARDAGRPVSPREMVRGLWGTEGRRDLEVLQLAMAALLKKFGDASQAARYIQVVADGSYILQTPG